MTVIPCFWNSTIVCARKRECSTSAELPSRIVYARSSKQRESPAVFLMSRPGPHGGVAARVRNACWGAWISAAGVAAVERSMAMVRYISRVFTGSPVIGASKRLVYDVAFLRGVAHVDHPTAGPNRAPMRMVHNEPGRQSCDGAQRV